MAKVHEIISSDENHYFIPYVLACVILTYKTRLDLKAFNLLFNHGRLEAIISINKDVASNCLYMKIYKSNGNVLQICTNGLFHNTMNLYYAEF